MKQDTTDVGHFRIYTPQIFGDSPYYRVRIKNRKVPGKPASWWSTKQTVYKNAKAAAITHCQNLLAEKTNNGNQMDFKVAFDRFLSPQQNIHTKSGYETILKHLSEFYEMKVGEITPIQIENYFKNKLESKDNEGKPLFQKTTLQNHFSLLKAFFGHCVDLELITTNPCKNLIRKRWLILTPAEKEQKSNKQTVTIEEARQILEVARQKREFDCEGPRNGTKEIKKWRQSKPVLEHIWRFIFIGFLTGWRRENLLTAKFIHLNLIDGIFVIPAAEMKSKQTFIAPMHPEFLNWVLNLPPKQSHPDYYLLTSSTTPVLDPNASFNYIMKKAGFPFLTPHSMRHSFGRWLSASNIPPAVKDALMDHHRADIASVYGRLNGKVKILKPYVDKLPWIFPLELVGQKTSLDKVENDPL